MKVLTEVGTVRYMTSSCPSFWLVSVVCELPLANDTVLFREFMMARWALVGLGDTYRWWLHSAQM